MGASARESRTKAGPRLYVRQRRLLALLEALGGNVGNLDFQKLLFLYCQELSSADPKGRDASLYEFVPYRYGAFSFTCYADRRRLVECGLLVDDENRWVLTEQGKHIAREAQDSSMPALAHRYHGLRGDPLIAETYRRYPYYAMRSETAEQVLQDDGVALRRIRDARPQRAPARLSTIGYEARTLEGYLNKLLRSSVTILCDVRRNAFSRKYGFSKTTLAGACDGVGIRYEHLPELGVESRFRQGLETQADFDALFKMYERRILPRRGDALGKIRAWLQSGESVALTCYEREASQCHRYCVAAELERMLHRGGVSERPVPSRKVGQTAQPHPAGWSYSVRHL